MKTPHKHAALIKEWADGAEIEFWCKFNNEWKSSFPSPSWRDDFEYRIKPEPKPDWYEFCSIKPGILCYNAAPNLKITFDGETGNPKAAEVLK